MSTAVSSVKRAHMWLRTGIYDNPVLLKELRTRMRGSKSFGIMCAYLLAPMVYLVIRAGEFSDQLMNPAATGRMFDPTNQNIGGSMFGWLMSYQALLLVFIIPALTAGSLSQEVEKKTMELLAITRIRASRLVLGKLASSVLYTFVLLVCTIPIAGICLMFGGISPAEIAITYLLFAVWVIMIASVGVFWSSLCQRTVNSSILAFSTTGLTALITYSVGAVYAFQSVHRGPGFSSMDIPPLATLFPSLGHAFGLMTTSICGHNIPMALIPLVLHLSIAALLLSVAITHVRFHKTDKSPQIRLLVLFLTIGLVWLLTGSRTGGFVTACSTSTYTEGLAYVGVLGLALFGASAAAFATGPVRAGTEKLRMLGFLSPRNAFRGRLAGALPFMLLWMVVAYAVLWLVARSASHAYAAPLPPEFTLALVHAAVVSAAVVLAISSFGILLSSTNSSRRFAIAAVILFTIVVMGAYAVIFVNYDSTLPGAGRPIWQLGAFWPVAALSSDAADLRSSMPKFWWPREMTWLVTSALYFLMSLVFLSLAPGRYRKTGGITED